MGRRLTLSFALVAFGFVAALVVTGRARTAADARIDMPAPAAAAAPPVP